MNHLKTFTSIALLALASLALMSATASATVLTDGSGNQLKTGTSITAESEGKTSLHPPIGTIECGKSHFGGKTTNDGGSGVNVSLNVESWSLTECNATFTVLKKGTMSIAWTSGSNGTLYSTGTEVTTVLFGFHCIFSTNATKLGTITGGTPATLDIEATIPRTGGSSGAFCGSTAQWTGSFKFTSPSTIKIDDSATPPPVSTILTDGSKNQLKTGTSITAENETAIALDATIGEIKCEASHLGGKTTSDGGGGANVSINVEAFTWSKCNATVSVLANGTLSIAHTSGSNGTLSSTGTELTVSLAGFHCIFKTSGTKLGTLTGSATTGGNSTLDIEATIARTGGSSGALCGSTASWTGSYKFTAPSALNID